MFKKESLDKLRERIDLIEVISGYVEMKRSGAAYKALCPFHQEKTPSFMIQKGDTHYHCFGCGAHGDAIQFLMNYLNLPFVEAVELLAERFHVPLEREHIKEGEVERGALKEVCRVVTQFFHAVLLYTEEGKEPLHYLYKRGITLDFIRHFEVGYAPSDAALFLKVMKGEKIKEVVLAEAGLIGEGRRPFFRDRIMFPISNQAGSVIGFSARKYKEATFGGKYINTPETPLFKKSRVLFGLNYCRRRIIKERRAVIVEGQIDCLKMIEAGLNVTVAALGTAFGEGHVEELVRLGLRTAYLLFDGDEAGKGAASKVGDLLQKKGIEVFVVNLPQGSDPDSFLTQWGMNRLLEEIVSAQSYLVFQLAYLSRALNLDSPAGKAEVVKMIKKQIEQWQDPIMVHESLRKVAFLLKVPEGMIEVFQTASPLSPSKQPLSLQTIDPNRILECDLLRWLILIGEPFFPTARTYLNEKHFLTPQCQKIFHEIIHHSTVDLLSLSSVVEEDAFMDEILNKKVNRERAESQFLETVQKLLDREWMQHREAIKMEIHSGKHSDEKILELAKKFDALKTERPLAHLIKSITA